MKIGEKLPIGAAEVRVARATLNRYKEGKANLERRVVDNAQWYKLRHWECMRGHGKAEVEPSSGWLFNAIANKHADAMDNFPSPNVLPRGRCCRWYWSRRNLSRCMTRSTTTS